MLHVNVNGEMEHGFNDLAGKADGIVVDNVVPPDNHQINEISRRFVSPRMTDIAARITHSDTFSDATDVDIKGKCDYAGKRRSVY